ncbi:MAG: PA14 domain-containing protein [Anaerolineae bacterium]
MIDAWFDQKMPNRHTADVYLAAGQHAIIVEYYEHGDRASVRVWWKPLDAFTGWRGEYYDNRDFAGSPVLVRDDSEINFDWGVGPPVDWMTDDNFAVRWTRTVNFTSGYYRFVVQADDGVRLWINQHALIDKWQDMDYELHYVDGCYMEGQYTIVVEYYEHGGSARVRAWWETGTNDDAPPSFVSVVPDSVGAAPAEAEDDPWEAAYFANTNLSGAPMLTRIETALDHNWSWGSPGAGVPKDYFSARWTQSPHFRAGTYRFTTYTDDGVRLWVDGKLWIDSWRPMRGYRSVRVWLSEGVHDLRMEYYERTGIALARLNWQRISR